jgi:hypothetical protein
VVGKAKVIIEISILLLLLLLLLLIPTLFRLVITIKDQVISMSLSATFTAAICNQSEALSGRHASQVPYTSALKRRESRAQLARALATRAVIAKDRYVVCNIMDAQPKTYHDRSCLPPLQHQDQQAHICRSNEGTRLTLHKLSLSSFRF